MWCSGDSTGCARKQGPHARHRPRRLRVSAGRWALGLSLVARSVSALPEGPVRTAPVSPASPRALTPAPSTSRGGGGAPAKPPRPAPSTPVTPPASGTHAPPATGTQAPPTHLQTAPVPTSPAAPSGSSTPAAGCPPLPPTSAVPLYRLTGYDLRQERMSDADWLRYLGRGRYRQDQASKWLLILGGATAFTGAISLLVGLGNLAGQTQFGTQPVSSTQPDFEAFLAGFGAMTGVGGAALLTGAILSWSLPDRIRPLYVPRFEKEEGVLPQPASPPRSPPLSSFPSWAFVAPPASTRAWIQ